MKQVRKKTKGQKKMGKYEVNRNAKLKEKGQRNINETKWKKRERE